MSDFLKNKKILLIWGCISFTSLNLNSASFFSKLSNFNKKNLNSIKEVFDNFYTVEKGKLYRSKQLSARKFRIYAKKYNIKTIVNLRGENPSKKWWQNENKVAKELGINLFNISMSALVLPSKENLRKLLDIYANKSLYPILIHCQGGADRTGEASALWLLDQGGKNKEEALRQLSITYGHRKYKNSAKDFFISNLWQGRDWALNEYDPRDYPKYCGSGEYNYQPKQIVLT